MYFVSFHSLPPVYGLGIQFETCHGSAKPCNMGIPLACTYVAFIINLGKEKLQKIHVYLGTLAIGG